VSVKTVQYLDAVKRRLGISSDYALAQALDLTKQSISQLRGGAAVMSPTTAARVAAILEIDPLRVIADAELERGSDAQLWRRLRDAAAAVLVAIGAALAPTPAEARFDISIAAVAPRDTSARDLTRLHIVLLRALAWLAAMLTPRWAAA
jgi:transcriptional regulator with XRE-family HTH domain